MSAALIAAKIGLGVVSSYSKALEMSRQIKAEVNLMSNQMSMLQIYQKRQEYDLERRAKIMQGRSLASAGGAGVAVTSASLTQNLASIRAATEIDKETLRVNVTNAINVLAFKQKELGRQKRQIMDNALFNGVVSGLTGSSGAFDFKSAPQSNQATSEGSSDNGASGGGSTSGAD